MGRRHKEEARRLLADRDLDSGQPVESSVGELAVALKRSRLTGEGSEEPSASARR